MDSRKLANQRLNRSNNEFDKANKKYERLLKTKGHEALQTQIAFLRAGEKLSNALAGELVLIDAEIKHIHHERTTAKPHAQTKQRSARLVRRLEFLTKHRGELSNKHRTLKIALEGQKQKVDKMLRE